MVEDSHVTWYSHTECIIQHSIATLVKKLFTSSAPLLRLVHFMIQTTSFALSLFFVPSSFLHSISCSYLLVKYLMSLLIRFDA